MRHCILLLALVGCHSNPAPSEPDGAAREDASSPDGPTRSYLLASAGEQVMPGQQPLYQLESANLADDTDVVNIHQEAYGVPWTEFANGVEPPAQWVEQMDRLAAIGPNAGKPVYLSLLLGRTTLADKTTIVNGQIQLAANWAATCYDFATAPDAAANRAAYLAYVEWMIRKFHPRWLNHAVEISTFLRACPSAWPAMVDVANAAYQRAKQVDPTLTVFPSFQLALLYGNTNCPSPSTPDQCFTSNMAALGDGVTTGLKRDRFAESTYPYSDGFTPITVPPDWFTRAPSVNLHGPERIIIAETGWNSTPIVANAAGTCTTIIQSSEADATAYFDLLIATARAHDVEMITWWSNRDLIDARVMTSCPCTVDATWCNIVTAFRGTGTATDQLKREALFKVWGAMGIRDYTGTPKPMLSQHWNQARGL